MQSLEYAMLGFGLILQLISWLTIIFSLIVWWRVKRHSSAIVIPFIGPILLTSWVLLAHHTYWLIPLVWIADIGTHLFLTVFPNLILDWWRTSSFTMLLTLDGTCTNQCAIITLHSSGQYLLRKKWKPNDAVGGFATLSETGTYSQTPSGFELIAHHGLQRCLKKLEPDTYLVPESVPASGNQNIHSLDGWSLRTHAATIQS